MVYEQKRVPVPEIVALGTIGISEMVAKHKYRQTGLPIRALGSSTRLFDESDNTTTVHLYAVHDSLTGRFPSMVPPENMIQWGANHKAQRCGPVSRPAHQSRPNVPFIVGIPLLIQGDLRSCPVIGSGDPITTSKTYNIGDPVTTSIQALIGWGQPMLHAGNCR